MAPVVALGRSAAPQTIRIAEHAPALRALVPGLAVAAAAAVEDEVADYRRPDLHPHVQRLALRLIGGFVERLIDPALPLADLLELCHRIGAAEAHAGRTTDPWNAAIRAAAGAALRWFDEEHTPGGKFTALAGPAPVQAYFDFVNLLSRAFSEGHATVPAHIRQGDPADTLIRLLLADPPTDVHQLRAAMREAAWSEPVTVAAVALAPHGPRFFLPPDILGAFATARPFLVVPDPDGPGRRQALRATLAGRDAALGPTVPLGQLGDSLRWARTALHLSAKGELPESAPGQMIVAARHAPLVLMSHDPLIPRLVEQRLAPLIQCTVDKRVRLAETFLALIETGFNCKRASEHIAVHPQTIRYRLRSLERLFGDDLYVPELQLEFHLYLRSWLASAPKTND